MDRDAGGAGQLIEHGQKGLDAVTAGDQIQQNNLLLLGPGLLLAGLLHPSMQSRQPPLLGRQIIPPHLQGFDPLLNRTQLPPPQASGHHAAEQQGHTHKNEVPRDPPLRGAGGKVGHGSSSNC